MSEQTSKQIQILKQIRELYEELFETEIPKEPMTDEQYYKMFPLRRLSCQKCNWTKTLNRGDARDFTHDCKQDATDDQD